MIHRAKTIENFFQFIDAIGHGLSKAFDPKQGLRDAINSRRQMRGTTHFKGRAQRQGHRFNGACRREAMQHQCRAGFCHRQHFECELREKAQRAPRPCG